MIGSLPPFTDEQLIEHLKNEIVLLEAANIGLKTIIKEQRQLIKELDSFIKDNI
jgi:hypothetical protein